MNTGYSSSTKRYSLEYKSQLGVWLQTYTTNDIGEGVHALQEQRTCLGGMPFYRWRLIDKFTRLPVLWVGRTLNI